MTSTLRLGFSSFLKPIKQVTHIVSPFTCLVNENFCYIKDGNKKKVRSMSEFHVFIADTGK